MSLVTRTTKAGIDNSTAMYAPQLTGLYAGEALDIAAPCYIKSSDGKVYMSNATNVDEAAEFAGFTARAVAAEQPVTLFGLGARFQYGTSLTPGDVYYMGATAGRLDTGATTGDTMGIAMAVTATDIVITRASSLVLNAVADGGLTGTKAAVVANANVVGGIPLLYRVAVASGANGDVDVVTTHKIRVVDFWFALKAAGTAGSLVTLKSTADAISDAVDCSAGGDRDVFRAGELNDANHEIAAGGKIRISKASTGGDFPGAECYVLAVRIS